jgi:predicted ATPase
VGILEAGARVATITGPGGMGKTRLATAVADRISPRFPDGIAYVELAAVSEPERVLPTVASAVGVKEAESRTLRDGLARVIGDHRVLLILDNLEQVIACAAELSALLRDCPALVLLSTSRAPLRISGEVEFPLRPLALPPVGMTPPLEDIETFPAVELFVERTRRARPGFRLSPENSSAVLQICRRLDGLPLALELAAARLRTLEPDMLLPRLEHALDVLTAGARDLPERQRTLRGTIDWSHSLLNPEEQRLFRSLGVFSGGWRQESIGPVCYGADEPDGLDAFESLVEQGLVRRLEGTGRFGMLETLREYAVERLAESGEEPLLRQRHAKHFRAFAAEVGESIMGIGQLDALARGDAEVHNLEDALAYYRASGTAGDASSVQAGLAICGSLWMYWHARGSHLKAHAWSRSFLDLTPAKDFPIERAGALITASIASATLGDLPRGVSESLEASSLADRLDPETLIRIALASGTSYLTSGDLTAARRWLEEAVHRSRALQQPWLLSISVTFLGILEMVSGELSRAAADFVEAIPIQRALGDHQGLGAALGGQAVLAVANGDPERALSLFGEALTTYHAMGDTSEEARILSEWAWQLLSMERSHEARERFAAAVRAYEEVGSVRGIGVALLGLAATHAAEGRPEQAMVIAAAAETFALQEGVVNAYTGRSPAPRYLDPCRVTLAESQLVRLEAEGRRLQVRDAVRYALIAQASELVPVTL